MNHDASRAQHLQVSRIGLVVARVCWVIYGSYSCMLLVVLPESTSVKRVASLEPWSLETYTLTPVILEGMAANVVCGCNNNETNVDREYDAYCHQQIVEGPTPRLRYSFGSYFYATVITILLMLGQRCIKYQHLEVCLFLVL